MMFLVGLNNNAHRDHLVDSISVFKEPDRPHSPQIEASSIDPIVIESDDDFEIYNWIGNGTLSNPYVLSNKTIEGERCIQISDTNSHFRIENCTLISLVYGIKLFNVENGIVIDCFLNSNRYAIQFQNVRDTAILQNTIISNSSAIDISRSTLCEISHNSIEARSRSVDLQSSDQCVIWNNSMVADSLSYSYATRFQLSGSNNSIVIDNTIMRGDYGFSAYKSRNCSILNNTIATNMQAIIIGELTNCSIIGNRFGSVDGETALDNGINNSWDDGISQGNAWYDYLGYGEYEIPGDANSIDHYPTRFDPIFPMDFDGPYIKSHWGTATVIDYCNELPDFFSFTATVNDSSGVDSVIITINHNSFEMTHQPSDSNPDLYVYDYPIEMWMTYSIWANDTIGLSSEVGDYWITVGVMGCPTSSEPTTSTTTTTTSQTSNTTSLTDHSSLILLAIGSGSFLVIVVVVILIIKNRESG